MKNLLSDSKSHYLLQHKDNPVAWQEWSKDTLNLAKALNKPLFISIGYSSCHWCHVMAHDCFEDKEIADYLNNNFVPIKIDKEEYPDLDKYYQGFLQATRQQGGWPLSIFATSEGKPFYGGTYFPKESKYGLPPFLTILKEISSLYVNHPEKINNTVKSFDNFNEKLNEIQIKENISINFDKVLESFQKLLDMKNGGLKGNTKFPNIPVLLFLLEKYSDNDEIMKFLKLTADNLCLSGIYDHIRGGFFRYTVDDKWNVPHYEKMLYDNALNTLFLIRMFDKIENPLYLHICRKTLNFLIDNMSTEYGFAASIDADSPNKSGELEEGYFYKIFNDDVSVLTESEASKFAQFAQFNDNTLRFKDLTYEDYISFSDVFEKISKKQADSKEYPFIDDKVISGWNMLLCYTLLEFFEISGEDYYFEYALELFHKIKNSLFDNGKIYRIRYEKHIFQHQTLEDAAYFLQVTEKFFELTREKEFLTISKKIIENLIKNFYGKNLLYYNTEKTVFETFDEAIPSAFGVFYNTCKKLSEFTDINIPEEISLTAIDRAARFTTAHPTLLTMM